MTGYAIPGGGRSYHPGPHAPGVWGDRLGEKRQVWGWCAWSSTEVQFPGPTGILGVVFHLTVPLIASKGRVTLHSLLSYVYVTVSLGAVPDDGALKGLPTLSEKDGAEKKKTGESSLQPKDDDRTTAKVAQQANTLMSLLNANAEWNTQSKTSRVWLGEGLGSIPKRVHDQMLRWEYVDMADFLPR